MHECGVAVKHLANDRCAVPRRTCFACTCEERSNVIAFKTYPLSDCVPSLSSGSVVASKELEGT